MLLTLRTEGACVIVDGDVALVVDVEPMVVLEPTERPRIRRGVG